jgi:predicted alpha/beta hydrolase
MPFRVAWDDVEHSDQACLLHDGEQYAYWRDYAGRERLAMEIKWHWAMPALAVFFGYVPAARLGWMEDTPSGVAFSCSRSRARFEDTYRRAPLAVAQEELERLVQ